MFHHLMLYMSIQNEKSKHYEDIYLLNWAVSVLHVFIQTSQLAVQNHVSIVTNDEMMCSSLDQKMTSENYQ